MALEDANETALRSDPQDTKAAGWHATPLTEISALGKCADLKYFRGWTDDPNYGRKWHSVRLFFGIKAFGVNAYEADEGEELILAHREADYGGYEEIYLVLRGRARFELDENTVELAAGDIMFVAPDVHRYAEALENNTLWIAFAGWPNRPYRHWNNDELA